MINQKTTLLLRKDKGLGIWLIWSAVHNGASILHANEQWKVMQHAGMLLHSQQYNVFMLQPKLVMLFH